MPRWSRPPLDADDTYRCLVSLTDILGRPPKLAELAAATGYTATSVRSSLLALARQGRVRYYPRMKGPADPIRSPASPPRGSR
jgi:hypothetical protein